MKLDDEVKIRYIMLTLMKGIGPVTQNALVEICGSIETCFETGYDNFINADKLQMIGKKRIEKFINQRENSGIRIRAEEIIKKSAMSGINVITREDDSFPDRFKNIADMPVVLYAKGKLNINKSKKSIGVVGGRRCSAEGKQKAIDITVEAVYSDIVIISGMAKGIDSYAHTAAIKSGGDTIAVLGNGVDICYPAEHERLYEKIAEQGCVLSEYPPETAPREYYFPRRNRLIAALSDKLYVIDAGRNSGTESTIAYCQKYGREVRITLPPGVCPL